MAVKSNNTETSGQLTDAATTRSLATSEAEERVAATLQTIDRLQREFDDVEVIHDIGYCLPSDFLLTIVVPIYNEEATVRRVITELFELPLPIEVIAVDDGSSDGSCAILTQLNREFPELRVVLQETNQGKGAALQRGFALATGTHLIVQDADLEYNPRDIVSLVEPLAKGEADVVYGSRFLEHRHVGSSLIHRAGNGLLTRLSNLITGWRLTDMETCYKVLRRDVLSSITLEQNGFGFEAELTAKLAQRNVRVLERPISYDARGWEAGKKIGWRDGLAALYCICRYR